MPEYALLIAGNFSETRNYETQPPDIPHKKVEWLRVVRDHGNEFIGREGDYYVFRKPFTPEKTSAVSARAARLALLEAGILSAVNNAIEQAEPATKIAWEYASEIYRDDPLVNSIAGMLNLSKSDIDALFDAAARF